MSSSFEEIHAFSRMAEGNGTEPHPLCTATAAELVPFIHAVMGLPKGARVVEIGTYTGRSTSVYLQLQKELDFDIHLIDCVMWNPEHAVASFWGMVTAHFNDVPFTFHKMTTNRAIMGWVERIDFLYIDGWHDPPQVDVDFQNWVPCVNRGGILAVHDSDYPGVASCLDKYVRGHGWQLTAEAERMTIWRKA